jgi:sugar lactone lactonase YvrE
LALFATVLLTPIALAEGTRTWEQSKFDDLTKGTASGVAIRSVGGLELAPAFKALYTAPSTYLWSIASDEAGNIYAAAGAPARVYRITPDGQASTIFEPTELQVQALVVDQHGVVYAATAPDGKVYKIERTSPAREDGSKPSSPDRSKGQVDPNWTSSVYFDPGTKYIWDLAFDGAGNLYVATGDRGELYKVTPKGEHSVFFKSDESHLRVLALDSKGNLIAGSDGSGLIYRIAPSGAGFVLYSAPKKEITALALDASGNIYASAVGEKRPVASIAPGFGVPGTVAPPPAPAVVGPAGGVTLNPTQPVAGPMVAFPAPGVGATGGSEIYRIAPDGSPRRLWTSREDIVYALAFDTQGRLLAGTGNRGHIFAIRNDDDFSDLLKAGSSQVTAFAKAPGGGLYASGSNLGKIFVLGPAPQNEGSYESDVFDAKIFSRWGRADFRGAGNVDLFARSGNVDNPDRNWSPWKKINLQEGGQTDIPAARFVQWKAVLHSGSPAPRVDSVTLNYLSKNVAPDIDDVGVQVGVRYQPLPKPLGGGADLSGSGANPAQPHFEPPVPTTRDHDSIGVKWVAHDDNDDQLVYSLYYRGDGETRWLLLKDDLTDKFYSFDASLLPDGGYTFKVVASDAPSHSPGEELTAEKESPRVEVDTTPPQIQNLNASVESDKIHVAFRAVDAFSSVKRAEYSIDANDWQYVEPVGQIADSKTENYDFRVAVPAENGSGPAAPAAAKTKKNESQPVEHVVVVRVYDRFDNMSSAKTVIRGK